MQEQQSDLQFLHDEAAFTSSGNFVLEASLTPHPLTPSPRLDPELGQMVRTSSSTLLQRRTLPAAGQLCEAIPSPTLARDANNGTHMISQPVASPLISPAKSSASTVSATSAANRLGDANAGAEQSIAKILILAEEMGFDSFDDLAATYYTATFSEGSLPRYAQSTSRSRRLRGLLTELHTSSRSWMGREARGYSDGQMRLLETVCVEELSGISAGEQHQIHRTQAFITNMIKQLFTHDGAEQRLEKDKDRLREQVSSAELNLEKQGPSPLTCFRYRHSGHCCRRWRRTSIRGRKTRHWLSVCLSIYFRFRCSTKGASRLGRHRIVDAILIAGTASGVYMERTRLGT